MKDNLQFSAARRSAWSSAALSPSAGNLFHFWTPSKPFPCQFLVLQHPMILGFVAPPRRISCYKLQPFGIPRLQGFQALFWIS